VTRFAYAIKRVSQLCGVVAAALIALGVLVVCQMVFIRYVLNQNTIWQTDFVTWSLVAATFIGSPYVLLTRGHVNVDVLPLYLGDRARWWLALVSILMSLAFSAVLLWLASRFWH
jgi:TRAP-type C4-dicarboxylate transport system permease small subunit